MSLRLNIYDNRMPKSILAVVLILWAAFFYYGMFYVRQAHSSYNHRNGYYYISIIALFSLMQLYISANNKRLHWLIILCCIGLSINIFLFEYFQITMSYELWVKKGMP